MPCYQLVLEISRYVNHMRNVLEFSEAPQSSADENGDKGSPLSIRRSCHRSISKSSWHVSSARLCRRNVFITNFLDHRIIESVQIHLSTYFLPDHASCSFFSQRSEDRKRRWRHRYEALKDARALKNGSSNPDGNLKKEVDFLIAQAQSEQNLSEAYDLGWSLGTLVTFWQVITHISRL